MHFCYGTLLVKRFASYESGANKESCYRRVKSYLRNCYTIYMQAVYITVVTTNYVQIMRWTAETGPHVVLMQSQKMQKYRICSNNTKADKCIFTQYYDCKLYIQN